MNKEFFSSLRQDLGNYSKKSFLTCKIFVCLFVCMCGVYRPTGEFFTNMETSPLPVKGCKFNFLTMLGTHGH